MVKISVSELEQTLALLKKTSQDMHILVREESSMLLLQFQSLEGAMTTVQIFDENSRSFAKVQSTENLSHTLHRVSKPKT